MLVKWIARQIGLDRNPLRRRSDRLEAWTTVLLAATFLLAGPLVAYQAATSAYRDAAGRIEYERHHRFQVEAVLLEDAVRYAGTADQEQPVNAFAPARWIGPDGTARTGTVVVDMSDRAGGVIAIWTDEYGARTPAPTRRPPSTDALLAGVMALAGLTVGVIAVWAVVLRSLNRRRMKSWQTEWVSVEPRWSGRRDGAR
jgi:hypothetical protein